MEKQFIPQLRFPEFEGSWEFRTGNKVFDAISNKDHNSDLPILAITQDQGAVPRDMIDYRISVTDGSVSSYKVVEKGDFIISLRSFQGGIEYSNYKGICSPAYIILRPNIEIEDLFYKYYLKTYVFIQEMQKRLEGIRDGKIISYKYFSEIKLPYPSLSEQEKIASFLSSVDTKISQLSKKKALLEQYKKGIMQQIFSQQIRFKDENGEEFPQWEEKKLNEFTTQIKRKSGEIISTVLTISAGKGFISQEERFSQIIAGKSLEKYTLLKKEEFSYNRGNSKSYTYGCIYKLSDYEEALVPNVYRSFTINEGCPAFFEHLFISKYLDRQLRMLISSSARMDGLLNIGQEDFYKCKLPIPSIPEQEKIASFLTSLDQKIEQVSKQLSKAQDFKKGLLQQMFV